MILNLNVITEEKNMNLNHSKTLKYKTPFKFILIIYLFSNWIQIYSQLPDSFINKVSYIEEIYVYHSMVEGEESCLNLLELASFRNSIQFLRKIELIDIDGELLGETFYDYEYNLRDSWITSYGKITEAKTRFLFYDKKGKLIDSIAKDIDNSFNLTYKEAVNYRISQLDDNFLNREIDILKQEKIPYSLINDVLSYNVENINFKYNHKEKFTEITEYNDLQEEIKKEIIYYTKDSIFGYFPSLENLDEFFTSSNANCKYTRNTITKRRSIGRELNSAFLKYLSVTKINKQKDFFITQNALNNSIKINSLNGKIALLDVCFFDLQGKLVKKIEAHTNKEFFLDGSLKSSGLYIIKVKSLDYYQNFGEVISIK